MDNNIVDNTELQEKKDAEQTVKKQKAALGGIRPDDWVEGEFKRLAKERGISRTELFESMFWNYYRAKTNEEGLAELNAEKELGDVQSGTKLIVDALSNIVKKAQNNLIEKNKLIDKKEQEHLSELSRVKDATAKEIELATLELTNKIKELENELSESQAEIARVTKINDNFNELKEQLESKISSLEGKLEEKNTNIDELIALGKEKDKANKQIQKELEVTAKNVSAIEKEIDMLKDKNNSLSAEKVQLESNVKTLNSTIETFNKLKEAELTTTKQSLENTYLLQKQTLEAEFKLKETQLNAKVIETKTSLDVANKALQDTKEAVIAETKNIKEQSKLKETQLTATIADKDKEIKDLKSKLEEKEALLKSLEDKII